MAGDVNDARRRREEAVTRDRWWASGASLFPSAERGAKRKEEEK